MKLTELFLAELDREVPRSRHALEQVPPDKRDWKPHDKSMAFGYLADMVATIPSWMAMIVKQDQLDIAPREGQQLKPPASKTSAEFVAALDHAAEDARTALRGVDDEFLQTRWQLLVGGKVVADMPRHEMLRET
ncbi:MAG: DinB family protein, partial [Vicinamibacterales bacterium]